MTEVTGTEMTEVTGTEVTEETGTEVTEGTGTEIYGGNRDHIEEQRNGGRTKRRVRPAAGVASRHAAEKRRRKHKRAR